MGDELREAFDATVGALALDGTDEALVALGRALADEIDERRRVADMAERAVRAFAYDEDHGETEVAEVLRVLRSRLAARETLDRLGARLHAVLGELGASPVARAKGLAPKARATGPTSLSRIRGSA